MLPRFYAPEVRAIDEAVALPPEEARHLRQVLRLTAGAEIAVFDGRGREFAARVVDVGRSAAVVRPVRERTAAPEPRVRMTLAVGALKANHLDAVVRDATTLGVAAIHPLTAARTNVPASALRRPEAVERWRRIAIASAKQCRRAVVPVIASAGTLAAFLRDDQSEAKVMFVEPGAGFEVDTPRRLAESSFKAFGAPRLRSRSNSASFGEARRSAEGAKAAPPNAGAQRLRASHQLKAAVAAAAGAAPVSAAILIGPEGGWTDDEVRLAASEGVRLATLGALTLRADVVPIVAIAALRTVWGDW